VQKKLGVCSTTFDDPLRTGRRSDPQPHDHGSELVWPTSGGMTSPSSLGLVQLCFTESVPKLVNMIVIGCLEVSPH
jgi:hypothetical protein